MPPLQWFACLEEGFSIDGTLSGQDRKRRVFWFVFAIISALAAIGELALSSWDRQTMHLPYLIGTVTIVGSDVMAVIVIFCKLPMHPNLVVFHMYVQCAAVFVWDLNARTVSYTMEWPMLILIIDMLLVLQMSERWSLGLVIFTVGWIVLLGFEESYRFGLLDLPGLKPQDGDHGRKETYRKMGDCTTLPCPVSFPPTGMGSAMAVFVIDFIVTRGFARQVKREQEAMERTINTVQEIASLLASYDVARVSELLEAHREELPEGMIRALRAVEENLRIYKAYLPKTCLPFEAEEPTRETNFLYGDSSSSCLSSSLSYPLTASGFRTVRAPMLGLVAASSTLLTVNVKATLRLLEEDQTRFSQLFSSLLIRTLEATDVRRGVVDIFIGDRIHCSFNASKQCSSHATSALHTATSLLRDGIALVSQVNIGVATGKVLRGDMGCDVMRRFSMVGPLVRDVHGMERAGRFFGCNVLCNRLCVSDAECEHDLRLIPCKVEVDTGCEHEVVAELIIPPDAPSTKEVDEWMYEIGGEREWDKYNATVRKYLNGEATAGAVAAAASAADCIKYPLTVVASLACDVLRLHIHSRVTTR